MKLEKLCFVLKKMKYRIDEPRISACRLIKEFFFKKKRKKKTDHTKYYSGTASRFWMSKLVGQGVRSAPAHYFYVPPILLLLKYLPLKIIERYESELDICPICAYMLCVGSLNLSSSPRL